MARGHKQKSEASKKRDGDYVPKNPTPKPVAVQPKVNVQTATTPSVSTIKTMVQGSATPQPSAPSINAAVQPTPKIAQTKPGPNVHLPK